MCTRAIAQTTDSNLYDLDHEWLVEVWSGVNRSQDRVETLTVSLEESAKLGLIDSVAHEALLGALDRERGRLESRRSDLYDALDTVFKSYKESPIEIAAMFQQAIGHYESIGKTRSANWLRDTLDLFQGQVQLAPIPPPLEERYEANNIAQVQQFLVTYMHAQVSIDDANGIWDQATEDDVMSAVRHFETSPDWNLNSQNPRGVLTPELYLDLLDQREYFLITEAYSDEIFDAEDFLQNLWSLRNQRIYVPESFIILADRLLANLLGVLPNGLWEVQDIRHLGEFFGALQQDPLYEAEWPSVDSEEYLYELFDHVWLVAEWIFQDPSYSDEYKRQALLIGYFIEALIEIEAETRDVTEAYLTVLALETVQETIISSGFQVSGLVVGQDWGILTAVGLSAYITDLQDSSALQWMGDRNGLYTTAFASHLRAWLDTLDPEHPTVWALLEFANAMDRLVARGVYSPSNASSLVQQHLTDLHAASQRASNSAGSSVAGGSVDWWNAFLLTWANGFAFEWGDELVCEWVKYVHGDIRAKEFEEYANDLLLKASNQGPKRVMLFAMIGRMMSVIGFIAAIFAGVKMHHNAGKAFQAGMVFEIAEGIVSYFGEWHTMGRPPFLFAVGFTLIAGLITGGQASLVSGEPSSSPKRAVRLTIAEIVFTAIFSFAIYSTFVV